MKIVLTEKQVKRLFEDASVSVKAKSNDSSAFANAATAPDTQKKMNSMNGIGVDAGIKVSGPNPDDSKPTITVDVPEGNSIQSVLSANQDVQKAISNNSSVELTGSGIGLEESICYTKGQIERARLQEMRKNGRVVKKKDFFNK